MPRLRTERDGLAAQLAALTTSTGVITLNPTSLARYASSTDLLARALADHAEVEEDRGPLVEEFRSLVHSVTVHPQGPRAGFEIEVKGRLSRLAEGGGAPRGSGGRVVAEERCGQQAHRVRMPFVSRGRGTAA